MSKDEREETGDEAQSSGSDPGVNGGRSPLHGSLSPPDPPPQKSDASPQDASGGGWVTWYRRLAPLIAYLPTGTREEDTDRDGILSYSVEVHSAVIGLSIGMAAATTHDVEIAMTLVAVALGVGRMQQQFSEKVQWQLKKEPAYALGGFAIGYGVVYLAQTGQLPPI